MLLLIVCFISRYFCTFHVQEYSMNSVAEMTTVINAALTSKYENGSISIQSRDVVIKHLGKMRFMMHMTC